MRFTKQYLQVFHAMPAVIKEINVMKHCTSLMLPNTTIVGCASTLVQCYKAF
jgi:hypothetical protein